MHRSPTRALALAAGCVGLAVFPAAAAARGALTVNSDPDHPTAGVAFDIHGKRTGPRHTHKPVTLFEKVVGVTRFRRVARTRTTAGGFYSFEISNVIRNVTFFVRSPGAKASAKLLVPIQPEVTFTTAPANGSNQAIGAPIPFTVNVSTKQGTPLQGAEVDLHNRDRRGTEQEDPIATATSDANGNAVFSVTFPGEPRPANIIARVPQTKFNAAGRTPLSSSFQLQEPQNSSFLLNVSANPIVSGSLVTVGALKSGGAGQSITFQNHPEGEGAPFSPFFTGTTDGNGFTSVTRAFSENQTFVATSGGSSSSRLSLGVLDNLSFTSNTTSTGAGTAIAFSGRDVPSRKGQNVEILEQAGTTKVNGTPLLNVRREVPINEDGGFSTEIELARPGPHTFFAAVLGGAENEGTISAPVNITVVPAT